MPFFRQPSHSIRPLSMRVVGLAPLQPQTAQIVKANAPLTQLRIPIQNIAHTRKFR